MSECEHVNKEVDTSRILTSLPPKYSWQCPDCGKVDYILCSEYKGEREKFLPRFSCPANHEQLYWGWLHQNEHIQEFIDGLINYDYRRCPPCPKCNEEIKEPE